VLRFKVNAENKLESEIYTIENNQALAKYVAKIAINQEITTFMDYIQNNGLVNHVS